ncbi:MAG: aminotransferase class I/II-fold pyridoxal phosphate-dependent enzyme [Thermoanaerobaculia bacterium]
MTRGRADFTASESADVLRAAVTRLSEGFEELPPSEAKIPGGAEIARLLEEVADRLQNNYPYFHPLYAGQMLKPPHPAARLAYALAMWLNPNNHALDGGRESSRMEKEAVAEIAEMFGWKAPAFLGHLCGGGTMANLEALWVAGRLQPGAAVVASSQAHYTHGRIGSVLGLPFEPIACDDRGRMDARALERRLERGGVGTVVATMGTTATGSVDPLPEILALRERHAFRLHADAAYGGYFGLADNLPPEARRAYDRLREVDSIVIDPHKHGLQPYGCGCVLFRDPSVGRFYKHDSPYTYFSSDELHLGEISLECSRPGAAAVALWATQRLLPLEVGGEFAGGLTDCRAAALDFHDALSRDARFLPAFPPELDIVVWIPRAKSASEASARSRRIFEEAARRHLHLALAELPAEFFELERAGIARDRATVTCLRSVLMKPEHREWTPRILAILSEAADASA